MPTDSVQLTLKASDVVGLELDSVTDCCLFVSDSRPLHEVQT